MSDERPVYIPLVKGKMWDLKALGGLSTAARRSTMPLVEAMPIPKDLSADEHIEKFSNYVRKFSPLGKIYVDFYGLLPGAVTADGDSAVIAGFQLLKRKGRIVTPVYGFERDDEVWPKLREVVVAFGQGFCFRIDIDDLDDMAESTWERVLQRSAELGLAPAEVDLVIDLRDIREASVESLKDRVVDFIALKPMRSNFRTICVAGSSALKTVTDVPKIGEADIERKELRLWSALQMDLLGAQEIVFGDYGVIHPDFIDVGPNKNKNGKIRYTSGVNIRYFRGHSLDLEPKFGQYFEIAARVRNSPIYKGRDYSFGDLYVDDVANMRDGPGHLGCWVRSDMNHHLEYTAKQMERLQAAIQKASSDEAIDSLLEMA